MDYGPRVLGCALACLAFTGIVQAASPYSLSQLTSIHKSALAQNAAALDAATRTGNSSDYYFTSIAIMGMLSAVETTGDESELQQAMGYVDNMIANAATANGHHVWYPLSDVWNYQGAQCIARTAAVIWKNPAFKAKYANKATSYVNFVDDLVIQYWYNGQSGGTPNWLTGDPADFNDGQAWNDKSWLLGDMCSSMYQVTGNTFYLNILNKIANAFRNNYLKPLNTGWIWNYHTIPIGSDTNGESGSVGNQEGSPDTDHSNRVPLMMVWQYEAGLGGWTSADIQRLANTLADTMWNQSTSNPSISNYVDGSNKPYRTHFNAGENGFIFAGWALIGKYSDKAQTAATSMVQAIENGVSNPSISENDAPYYKIIGVTGFALRTMLSSGGSAGTPSPVPALTSLSPSAAKFGGPAFTMTVTGSNFVQTSTVLWAGQAVPTTYVSATQLAAAVPATLIQNQASISVTVSNPAPGGGVSPALPFLVTDHVDPPPTIDPLNFPATLPVSTKLHANAHWAALIHWKLIPQSNPAAKGAAAAPRAPDASAVLQADLVPASIGTVPGAYTVQAVAENAFGVQSAPAQADITFVNGDLNNTRVYPNPWRSDLHSGKLMTFDGLSGDTQIRIFTVAGQLVRTLSSSTGSTTWDLNNDSGDRIGSGLYLYLITNDQGQRARGKLAVIK